MQLNYPLKCNNILNIFYKDEKQRKVLNSSWHIVGSYYITELMREAGDKISNGILPLRAIRYS